MNLEKIKKLECKIHDEIPMTRLMNLELKEINENFLTTTAPLDININDKGSAFGGSLASITIISSWCLARLIANDLGYEDFDILIIKNESSFSKQVLKQIVCECTIPTQKEINILKEKLTTKGSASLKISAKIIEDGNICMNFDGIYVIKQKD